MEEPTEEAPRSRARPRVITESRFETQTPAAPPPQLFLPAPTAPPAELPLEAISKTFTTTKIDKSTEDVSEPASASSVDSSSAKEEVPATEPVSEVSKEAASTEGSSTTAAARKGRVNPRLQSSSTEATTANPRGRSRARSGRRQDNRGEEVAQQTAPVAQVVHHPNARINRGRGRSSSAEVKEESAPPSPRASVRVAKKLVASESRRNTEVKAPLDLATDGRPDQARREARGYARSNSVTSPPEIVPSPRTNIVRVTRRPQQDVETPVRSNSIAPRRNDRQERVRAASTTEAPSRRNVDRRRGNQQPSTTSAPAASRPTDIRSRSRSRLLVPPVLDEQKLEVLPLFESETATVRIAPLATTRRRNENEIPTSPTPRKTTPRHTTPKPKPQWEEESKKPQVKETIQVSNVKEITTKRKIVRRKKIDRDGENASAESKTTERSQARPSTTAERSTERSARPSSTTRAAKTVTEYFDRSFLQSTDFPVWGTTGLREKGTFDDHNTAWLNFDQVTKVFNELEQKTQKAEVPRVNGLDRGRNFDYKNEIAQEIPTWNYQGSSVATTVSRRESTTAVPRTTEKQYNDYGTEVRVKDKVKKKIVKVAEAPQERRTNERTRNGEGDKERVRTTANPGRNKASEREPYQDIYEYRGPQSEKRTNDRIVSQESNDYRQKQQFKTTAAPENNDIRQKEKQRVVIPIKVNAPRHNEKLHIKTTENPDRRTTERHYRTSSTDPYDYSSKEKQVKSTTEVYDRRNSGRQSGRVNERVTKQEQRLLAEIPEGRSTTRVSTTPTTTTTVTTTTTPSTSRTTRLYSTPEASTDRQRTREEAKVTVSQVITKSRGSKKGTKKKSDAKEEEDIDESDNYPEPFKALIQAKKEKDPTVDNVKVGVGKKFNCHHFSHAHSLGKRSSHETQW